MENNKNEWIELADPNEQVVYGCNPSAVNYWKYHVIGMLLIPIVVGLFIILYAVICAKLTKYIVTNKRVIVKTGLLNVRQTEIWVKDIPGVSMNRSFFQLITGTGNIVIGTAATADAEIVVQGISKPQHFVDVINALRVQ